MTDDKTPGDGTHELSLPERPGAGGSNPSTPAASTPASSTPAASTPAQPAEGFTWGLRPRGPGRSSAPPTAAIVLPTMLTPSTPSTPPAPPKPATNAPDKGAGSGAAAGAAAGSNAGAGAGAAPRTPGTARRARVTEPTEPPPLVEPPRTKRNFPAAELATQAMSLEEILAAQAASPVSRETWSRPIPTQGRTGAVTPVVPADDSVHVDPHSRRAQKAQSEHTAEAEAAAITSMPAALAPATAGARGAAPGSSTSPSTAGDADLSTQALSARDVADAATPRYRPRRAHLPEGVHDRNPAPDTVVVAPTFHQPAVALPQLPPARSTTSAGIQRSAIPTGMPHAQKVLLWIAGSLVIVLVLVAMYLLSSRLGEQSVIANPGAAEAVDGDPTPVLTEESEPLAPGVHAWNDLVGGECLSDFESPWAEEFTVVACDTDHTAQVLARSELSAGPDAPFPGSETLTTDVGVLCGLPAVLNYGEAAAVSDIQVSSSFPVDAADWATGDRTYFCFVDRASGEALPGDLRVVPAS